MRPRLVAVDVDGTLLDSRHRLSPATIAAVRRATEQAGHVVLATSRAPVAIQSLLVSLGLVGPGDDAEHFFIASQGAVIGAYTGSGRLRVVHRAPMPLGAALELVGALPAGVAVNWYTPDRWLVAERDALVAREAAIVGCEPEVVDLRAESLAPDKLLLLVDPADTELLGAVAVPAGLAAVRSTPTHLEVTAGGVDKAAALARLCSRLGIETRDIAAIGDGANDLPMLSLAGVAVAPANAVASVLRIADLVTGTNDEDCVARALEVLLGW